MKKKLISSILAFCMILSLIPMSVFAAAADYKITVTESGGTGHVAFTGATKATNYDYYTVNDTSVTEVSFEVTPPTDCEVKSVTYTVGTGEAQTLDAPYSIKVSDITDDVAIAITYEEAAKAEVSATITETTATSTVTSSDISESLSGATGDIFVIAAIKNGEDGDSSTETANVTTAEVTLKTEIKSTLESASSVTTIQIDTHAGSISIPKAKLASLLTDEVTLVIDTNTTTGSDLADVKTAAITAATAADSTLKNAVVEPISVSFVKSDKTSVSVSGTEITLSFPTPDSLKTESNPVVFYVNNGEYEPMSEAWAENNTIYFKTTHLSDFIATDAKTAEALNPEKDDETPGETSKVTCTYNHQIGLFGGQLKLTGLDANSKYVCQMAKVGETGSHAGYAIVVFETGANETTQTIEVLGNANGYYVDLYKYPNSNPSSITEFPTESHVIISEIAK